MEKARVDEWMKGLDTETRKTMEDEGDEDEDEADWFKGGPRQQIR